MILQNLRSQKKKKRRGENRRSKWRRWLVHNSKNTATKITISWVYFYTKIDNFYSGNQLIFHSRMNFESCIPPPPTIKWFHSKTDLMECRINIHFWETFDVWAGWVLLNLSHSPRGTSLPGNIGLVGLSLSIGAWGAPKWRIPKGSSFFVTVTNDSCLAPHIRLILCQLLLGGRSHKPFCNIGCFQANLTQLDFKRHIFNK